MAAKPLDGMKIAILVGDDFEQVELTEPKKALEEAGAVTMIVSPEAGEIHGMKHDQKADTFKVDLSLDQAKPDAFDAVMLPGGALNADVLRMDQKARDFVRFFDQNKRPIAAICHAPWVLISSGCVKDRTLTSYYTIQDDIRNAGGKWIDQEVVRDGDLVTSRQPTDIPAFNPAMISLYSEYKNQKKIGARAR